MLNDNDKQKIKDLWVNGASRDSIAIALGKGKDDVQEYINRISPFFENKIAIENPIGIIYFTTTYVIFIF